jgi:hypothetical protein
LIDLATHLRQEILDAALAQHNALTALKLAKLEYAPDYTIGYEFDNYLLSNAAPAPTGLIEPELVSEMDAKLQQAFPGVSFAYSQ